MSVPGKQVKKARHFLRKNAKAGSKDINPRLFAAAAAEQHASFNAVLSTIRYYYASGDERAQMRHDQLNSGGR